MCSCGCSLRHGQLSVMKTLLVNTKVWQAGGLAFGASWLMSKHGYRRRLIGFFVAQYHECADVNGYVWTEGC